MFLVPSFMRAWLRQVRRRWLLGRTSWPLAIQLLVAVLVPIVACGALSLHERRALMREGAVTSARTVNALAEHAEKVLETHALVLALIDAQLRDRSWRQIERNDTLRRTLLNLSSGFPQIQSIVLADAGGRVRQWGGTSGAAAAQTGTSIAGRDDFRRHAAGTGGRIEISAPFTTATGERAFAVSMRRSTADDSFDGVISVAVSLAYFSDFWKQFTPTVPHVIPLVRADGTLLLRDPPGAAASQIEQADELQARQQVGSYPLYVSFSLDKQAWLASWRERAAGYAGFALLMSMALVAAALLALRQARAQREASIAWRRAAHRSEAEMRRREKLEAQLVQAQKMEAVGQLTGGVAHDFNNLLHAIGLNVHVAQTICSEQPQLSKCLASIRRAVDRAAQLTRQLTAFSRRQALEPRSIAPADMIVRMADMLHRTLGGKIQIEVDASPGVHNMLADPGQTELAVLNLAVNARDAMPEGGRLGIRLRDVAVAMHPDLRPGDYVEMAICDNGVGMPAEVVARAFEPFFTTKPVGKGTGLGLSMVHGFARQSGGTVVIESHPGQGTTVRLLLPRARQDQAAPAHEASTGGPTPLRSRLGGRVLLVDDDSLVRNAMHVALTRAGYDVQVAASGPEALQALRASPPDVLVTDYAMPMMNGLELARLASDEHPALRVIMVTGYADPIAGADFAPVQKILHKPFHEDELVALIEGLLWSGQRQPEVLDA